MQARFMIEKPDDIQATMKITMSVKEWTAIRDQLADTWPSWQFSVAITQIISDARKVYYADERPLQT